MFSLFSSAEHYLHWCFTYPFIPHAGIFSSLIYYKPFLSYLWSFFPFVTKIHVENLQHLICCINYKLAPHVIFSLFANMPNVCITERSAFKVGKEETGIGSTVIVLRLCNAEVVTTKERNTTKELYWWH